jgi:hypothetical protein
MRKNVSNLDIMWAMESDKLKAHHYPPIGGFSHPYLKKRQFPNMMIRSSMFQILSQKIMVGAIPM